MNTQNIYDNIDVLTIYNKVNENINNVKIDTRKITNGDCYVGIKGEKNDGNLFYMEALKKGATIAILDNYKVSGDDLNYLKENNKSIVVVKNTIKALGSLAKYKRSLFTSPVVAITGSAGKTSTKDIIYSILKEKYDVHKTIGNQNNHLGLPLTILALDEKVGWFYDLGNPKAHNYIDFTVNKDASSEEKIVLIFEVDGDISYCF